MVYNNNSCAIYRLSAIISYKLQMCGTCLFNFKLQPKTFHFFSLDEVDTKCYDAFNYGRREEALRLLKRVKDPHRVKSKSNFHILHCAAYHGWLDVVKQLINDHGFDPDCEDDSGNTPLSKARSNGKQSVVDYLEMCTFLCIYLVYNCLDT